MLMTQEALESVTSRQGELQGDNAQLAAENELLRHETEAMTRSGLCKSES